MIKYNYLIILLLFVFTGSFAGENYPGSLKMHNGSPTLYIGNTPVSSTALRWLAYRDYDELISAESTPLEKFNEAGVKIVVLGIGVGWSGEGKYDYEKIDKVVGRFLKNCPDSYLVMSIYLRRDMYWFPAKYPDERFTYEKDGKLRTKTGHVTASLFSKKFETGASEALKRFVRHMEEKGYAKKIIGYQVNWGRASEWLPWMRTPDMNPQAIKAFRDYLKEKYKDVEKLRTAWKMSDVDFNNAMPEKTVLPWESSDGYIVDQEKRRRLLDYTELLQNRTTYLLLKFTGLIKKFTNGKALAGAYTSPGYRWQYFDKIVNSSNVDFGVSSCFYINRGPGGISLSQAITVEAYRKHGKLYWHDIDMRSYLWKGSIWGTCENPYESIMVMRREYGYMLAKGAGNIWFNLYTEGNVFDSAELMKCVARLQKISNCALDYNSESNAEIAVVYDSKQSFRMPLRGTSAAYEAYARIGAPCDFYPIHQLDQIPDNKYKLIVFVSCVFLDENERRKVESLKSKNRTLLFMYANGFFRNNKFDLEAMEETTGFKYEKLPGRDMYMDVTASWQKLFSPRIAQLGQLSGPDNTYRFCILPENSDKVIAKAKDGKVLFAYRKHKNWNSFYYSGYQMRTDILRPIANMAGVHIYYPYNDGTYAGNEHIGVISGGTGGPRQLTFKKDLYVYDIYSDEICKTTDRKLKLTFMPYETKIIFTGNKQEVEAFRKKFKQ
jgi:beta-galactosidase